MRSSSLVSVAALMFTLSACGSSSSDGEGGGEITSQEDVQQLFEAIMPELTDSFTELAGQQPVFSEKQSGSVSCPGGGTLDYNAATGQAALVECTVRGIVINASLALFVQSFGRGSYQANFNGVLTITGTFSGTVQVNQAFVQWSDPPSEDTTYWEATVTVLGRTFFVSSGSQSGGVCDDAFGSAPGYLFCGDTGDGCKFYAVLNESTCNDLCGGFGTSCAIGPKLI